jgi:hypothetical protein
MQFKTTPEEPLGKDSLREEELAEIRAVLSEFENPFSEGLPVLVA